MAYTYVLLCYMYINPDKLHGIYVRIVMSNFETNLWKQTKTTITNLPTMRNVTDHPIVQLSELPMLPTFQEAGWATLHKCQWEI